MDSGKQLLKMIEIERKFLVLSDDFKKESVKQNRIVQAYLSSNPERSVRIRIKSDKAYMTVKGKGNDSGMTRLEWETEITVADAEKLLNLCEKGRIDKIRYEVPIGNHVFEIDVFHGENEGLTVAEIELQSEDEPFERPNWLGQEVTNNERYYNASLSKYPFKEW